MKILVIDLLRLGDMIMTVPVINGLSARRPDAQIDVLTFKPVSALHPMLPHVGRWWTVDRDELQVGMGRADLPMLTSFAVLQEQLDAINGENYDLIINLTQTRFSAWVSGYLKSSDRLGLTFDQKGFAHFYSPWFRYLDEHANETVEDVFHHTDIFTHACGLGEMPRSWDMRVTPRGKKELEALNLGRSEVVALQMFTSDEKKNWPLESWRELVIGLKARKPDCKIVALGSPSEQKRLEAFIESVKVEIIPAIVSLEGAIALLQQAKLLVTGDTSIKHLANAGRAKVLELCVGWSDHRRTGIYKSDSVILKGVNDSRIPVETVLQSALSLLNPDWHAIGELARENGSSVKIFRSRELKAGFWFAQDLAQDDSAKMVTTLVERCAWKISLNRERQREFSQFGSEGISLRRELRELIPSEFESSALAHLDFLERQGVEKCVAINGELISMKHERPTPSLQPTFNIAAFRKRQIELEFVFQHLEHKTKLIRTLKSNWTECI